MRWSRHMVSERNWTSSHSRRPTGLYVSMYPAPWRWYSAASSDGSRTVRPVNALFTAFSEDLALPSSDWGPVDSWAFCRLAARRRSVQVLSLAGSADSDATGRAVMMGLAPK